MRTNLNRRAGEKPYADHVPAHLHDRKAATFNAEAAANGFVLPDGDFNSMSDGDLLTLRADLRRLLNVWTDKAHAAIGRHDHAAAERFSDAVQVAGSLVNLASIVLDGRAGSARTSSADALFNTATGERFPILRTAADFHQHYGRNVSAAQRDGVSLHDFLKGVAGLRTTDAVRAALSEGTGSAGGYTVPSLVAPKILEALVPASSLLSAGTGIVPLQEAQSQTTFAAVDTVPTAAWRAEGGNVTESDPAFRAVVVTPKSLAFYFTVSRELLADGIGLEAGLYAAIGQAFAVALDKAGLRGAGSATEPYGILNTSGIQSVTNGAAGASLATTKYANVLSAAQKIAEANAPAPTAAIMSPRSQFVLAWLADTTGQPVRRPPLIEAMKFIATTAIPNNLTVGGSTDCSEIYVADFTRAAFFLREQMNVMVAKEIYAGTGQIGFFAHVRADFACWYPAAFALVTGVRP